jgi:hypothetical protein
MCISSTDEGPHVYTSDSLQTMACDYDSESSASTQARPPSSASSNSSTFIFPTTSPAFFPALRGLERLLRLHEPSSEVIQNALGRLQLSAPFHPPFKIIAGQPYILPFPQVRWDLHLHSTFEDALDNIGKPISDHEAMYLRYLIQHPSGWSATPKQHCNAIGFQYLNKVYPQLGGLRPVLDNIVWPEEAQYFPPGLGIDGGDERILFISEAGYYFYRTEEITLFQAGTTLEEVFEGIKYCKYLGPVGPQNDEWESVEPYTEWSEPSEYFPRYRFDNDDPHWKLAWQIPELPEVIDEHVVFPHTPVA